MQDDWETPGKIFEYIGAKKKILGCVPKGYMRTIIEEAGGDCVEPTDVNAIAGKIVEFGPKYERNELKGARTEIAEKYNRLNSWGELTKIFTKFLEV